MAAINLKSSTWAKKLKKKKKKQGSDFSENSVKLFVLS